MRKVLLAGLTLALVVATSMVFAEEDKEVPIKEVMKVCMKGGLCKKCADGKGTEADKKKLLSMFQALAKNKPPMGDEDSWKEKTGALVAAAKEVVADSEGAGAKLKKAANCGACHKLHKPAS